MAPQDRRVAKVTILKAISLPLATDVELRLKAHVISQQASTSGLTLPEWQWYDETLARLVGLPQEGIVRPGEYQAAEFPELHAWVLKGMKSFFYLTPDRAANSTEILMQLHQEEVAVVA